METIGSMQVLVCGANGFIGAAVCEALVRAGHRVRRGVRTLSGRADEVHVDFAQDQHAEAWVARLEGVDALVNAVGTLSGVQLRAVHALTPIALFAACARTGVARVVQISALGAAANAPTPFLRTKHEADLALTESALDWMVLRPSLVAGRDGASSRWFRSLAVLPVVPLPGRGRQTLQPVALSDLVEAVVRALACRPARRVVEVVGPASMSYRQMLAHYRALLGLGAPIWMPAPMPLVHALVRATQPFGARLASTDALRMLEAGSAAPGAALEALLERPARRFTADLESAHANDLRAAAALMWGKPLLRGALAILWLVTAWVSVFVFPVWDSFRMLARVGAPAWSAPVLLVGASVVDAALGVLTLVRPSRALWWTQLALIVLYSAIIAWRLPEMWAHPFGPLLKNVPIVAILLVLLALTPSRRGK